MKMSKQNLSALRSVNMLALITRAGSREMFCELSGCSPGHVGQMATGHRAMGELVARRIEVAFNLPAYWMDQQHDEDGTTTNEPQTYQPKGLSAESLLAARCLDALPDSVRHQIRIMLATIETALRQNAPERGKRKSKRINLNVTTQSSTEKESNRHKGA